MKSGWRRGLWIALSVIVSLTHGAQTKPCSRCGRADCEYVAGINLAGAEFASHTLPGVEGRHYG